MSADITKEMSSCDQPRAVIRGSLSLSLSVCGWITHTMESIEAPQQRNTRKMYFEHLHAAKVTLKHFNYKQ